MQTIAIILFGIVTFLLIAATGIVPRRSPLSTYELMRRRDDGNKAAAEELRREVLLDDVLSLKKVVEAVLLVAMVATAIAAFRYGLGVLAAIVVALTYNRLARIDVIRAGAERFYEQHDSRLIGYVDKHPQLGKIVRSVTIDPPQAKIGSRAEVEHVIKESGNILTADEKKLICNGLHFNEKTVEQIMTPRGVIDTIAHKEFVGPLTLDALHKTGHSRFPVIDGDIDHVVGILHLHELLTIDSKRKHETAAQAMEKKVYYINQDQTLEHALAAFLKTRHHLFVVVNGYRETAGIVTLEDVIEALLGRQIVDEFDVHDDLRAVAERTTRTNNNPPHATNV